jgi:hypothetical protein
LLFRSSFPLLSLFFLSFFPYRLKHPGGQPLPSFVSTTTAVLPPFVAAVNSTSSSSPSVAVPLVVKTTAPCAPNNKGGNALAVAITNIAAALTATRVPPFAPRPQPLFARTNSSAGYPDSAYLSAFTEWVPGRLAVFRGTQFEYPDTQAGELVPPPPPRDLRFSSLCLYKYQSPFPLVSCAADFEMPLDNLRRYTVVSGLPRDKPSDAALAASSAVWVPGLEAGDASSTPGLALFRTMLSSPGFARAVQDVPRDASPQSAEAVMQQNYPKVGSSDWRWRWRWRWKEWGGRERERERGQEERERVGRLSLINSLFFSLFLFPSFSFKPIKPPPPKPQGVYCQGAVFAAGGFDACVAAAAG